MAGFADLDVMQRARRLTVGAVMLVIGGVVGYALPQSNASPSSETGSVTSVGNVTTDAGLRFSFTPAKGKPQILRLQDATPWQPDGLRPLARHGPAILPESRVDQAGQGDARDRHGAGSRIRARPPHCRLGRVLRLTCSADQPRYLGR